MGLSLGVVSSVLLHSPERVGEIYRKEIMQRSRSPSVQAEFVRGINTIRHLIEEFAEGRYSPSFFEEMARMGIHSVPDAYRLWTAAAGAMGHDMGTPLMDRNDRVVNLKPRPRPIVIGGSPSDERPDLRRMIRRSRTETGDYAPYPAGIIRIDDPFSIRDLFYSLRFGYGCCDETVAKLLRVAELRRDEAVSVLEEFYRGIPKLVGTTKRPQLDRADMHLVEMMNFVAERLLVPLGVPSSKFDIPENAVKRGIPCRSGLSFELRQGHNLDERVAYEANAGYVIVRDEVGVRVYQRKEEPADISVARVDDGPGGLEEVELLRIALRVGFGGKWGIDKDNPPFTLLKGKGMERVEEPLILPKLWELLESLVAFDPDDPESAWREKGIPIAVEDKGLIETLDWISAAPVISRLERIRDYAKRLADEHVAPEKSPRDSARDIFEIITAEAAQAKNHQDTPLGCPVHYEHFLTQLKDTEVIKQLHKMLAERQKKYKDIPKPSEIDRRAEKLVSGYQVNDRLDEVLLSAARDAVAKEREKYSGMRPPFRVSRVKPKHVEEMGSLGIPAMSTRETDWGRKAYQTAIHAAKRSFWEVNDYSAAYQRAMAAVKGSRIGEYELQMPILPVEFSQLRVKRYMTRLHSKCPAISPDVVSYNIFV